jgi:putative salt-induced outer membrane protein YdiY
MGGLSVASAFPGEENQMGLSNISRVWAGLAACSFAATAWASDFGLPSLEFPYQEQAPETDGDQGVAGVEDSSDPTSFWSGWTRSVEFGLTGSAGNTENLNIRAIFETERETAQLRTLLRFRYLYGEDEGNVSENEGRVRGENDWLFPGERYFVFAFGVYEFDEFQDWDTRLQLFGGLGYEFLKERALLANGQDRATLTGRLGAGATREFGGSDDTWHPEALIGLDFVWEINDRNTFAAGTEVFPALDDFGEVRTVSYATYDVLLAEETDLRLRLGVEHEYDSDAGDAKENDVKYFVTILATF